MIGLSQWLNHACTSMSVGLRLKLLELLAYF